MKIELYYDPVKPETMVCIDGQMMSPSDIYGFLYPVRRCLLQTWLMPSGSWSGLARQLQELSRGEEIELTFTGRKEDYEDVQSALKGMERLTLRFQRANLLAEYASRFGQMESKIKNILDENGTRSRSETLAGLFPEAAKAIQAALKDRQEDNWVQVIRTEADFLRADQAELRCCIVAAEYLDSYEKLEKLSSLTRAMRRSQDMICCCVENAKKRADLARYAAQYDNLQVRFDSEAHCKPMLKQKYGEIYTMWGRLKAYERAADILTQCYAQREDVRQRRTQLAKERAQLSLTERRELEHCKTMLNWFDRKEIELEQLNELIKGFAVK